MTAMQVWFDRFKYSFTSCLFRLVDAERSVVASAEDVNLNWQFTRPLEVGTKINEGSVEEDDQPRPELWHTGHDISPPSTDSSQRVREQGMGQYVVLPFPDDMFLAVVGRTVADSTFLVRFVGINTECGEIVEDEGEYDQQKFRWEGFCMDCSRWGVCERGIGI